VNEGIIFGREEKLHMKRAFLRVLQKVLSKMSYEGD